MAELPVIDPQSVQNLRDLNPGDNDEFLRELVGIYLEDTPLRITELETALAAGDTAKFVRAAHSIKGSSANLGAMALRGVAEELEHVARRDGIAGLENRIGQIKVEFARVRAEFARLVPPA